MTSGDHIFVVETFVFSRFIHDPHVLFHGLAFKSLDVVILCECSSLP